MKKLLLLSALLATSFGAKAEIDALNIGDLNKADAKIIVGISSFHFDSVSHEMLNESNPSIGFEAWDIQAVYVNKNSWNNNSIYLTYAPDWEINKYLSLSLQVGVATGYECGSRMESKGKHVEISSCSESGVIPLGALTVDYSPLGNDFNLSLSVNHQVAMFSVNYDL